MPTLTMLPSTPKPSEPISVTGAGYSDGVTSRDVRVVLDGKQIDRFSTRTGVWARSYPGMAAGQHLIEGNATTGCASVSFTVQAVVVPPVDPPPTTGIPPIGPKPANALLHKDFADGLLFPFVEQVYPNDHPYVPGNGQYPSQYCRYAKDAAHISVHDGYLDLRCTKGSPFWTGAFVATFEAPGAWPPKPTFAFQYGLSEVCAAIDAGTASGQNAAWPGPWYLDPKTSQEIDWDERIRGKDTANVRPGPTQPVSRPPVDSGWHVWGLLREPAKLTFYLDGGVVGTKAQSLNAPMSLLADSKVGLADPNTGATPDVVRMRIAWWKVKP